MTENKRRYRARRKEYVSDLERRLAEGRERGIQATTEVQLAARRVKLENGRLRELLTLAGFRDEEIDVWVGRGDSADNVNTANDALQREVEQKARRCATFAACYKGQVIGKSKTPPPNKIVSTMDMGQRGYVSEGSDMPDSAELSGSKPDSSNHRGSNAAAATSPPATSGDPLGTHTQSGAAHGKQIFPCKLLTRLAEDPGADITQIPDAPSLAEPPQDAACHGGGVECRKAYEMLIPYATSEEKMDYIARALESGCTLNGKGGCAVKSDVIWQALDDM